MTILTQANLDAQQKAVRRAVLAALVISAPGSPIDPDGTPYASPSEHAAAVTAGITA